MTEKRANEILRTKYPEAEIVKNMGGVANGRIAVIYQPGGKVYAYQASSYQQVLAKLGFKILYKHNVDNMKEEIKRLETEIEAGGYENMFVLPGEDEWYTYTEEEIAQMRSEIDRIKNELATAIID